MKISVMVLGPIRTNCYLAADEKTNRCAVIDPGASGERVAEVIKKAGLTLDKILLTHAHFDHTGGLRALKAALPAPIYVYPDDAEADRLLGISRGNLIYDSFYEDGDELSVGELRFRVLHTPGHTPGSVCLLAGDALFTGDTLFAGDCGRTDLPGGDYGQMLASLAKLGALEGDLLVLPGHEEQSTLDDERAHNPNLREAMGR